MKTILGYGGQPSGRRTWKYGVLALFVGISLSFGAACNDTIVSGSDVVPVATFQISTSDWVADIAEFLTSADSSCANCDGDTGDDVEIWSFAASGATDTTIYIVNIGGEDITFQCLAASGCTTGADVEAGLIAAINDSDTGSSFATAEAGSVIIRGKRASETFTVTLDDDGTGNLGSLTNDNDAEADGDTDAILQLLLILGSSAPGGGFFGGSLPENLLDLLPSSPLPNEQMGPYLGTFILPCNNLGGYFSARVYYFVRFDADIAMDWSPVYVDTRVELHNCVLEGQDGEIGITGNLPTVGFDGNLRSYAEAAALGAGMEGAVLVTLRGSGTAFDPTNASMPGAGEPVGIWFAPLNQGGTPWDVDAAIDIAVDGMSGAAVVDGGVCLGGAVSRNFSVIDTDDMCVEGSTPGIFIPYSNSCTLGATGTPDLWIPLVLAAAILYGMERRRRKAHSRQRA